MSEREPDSIGDEATRWFLLLRDSAATEADRRACAAWLAADQRHAAAWQEVAELWAGLQPLATGDAVGSRAPARRSVLLRGLAGLVAAGGLLGAGGALTLSGLRSAEAAIRTPLVQRRALVLTDGTQAELNGGSALTPLAGRRGVAFFAGEAFFTVPPGNEPFLVEAQDGSLLCDAGAFNVRLSVRDVEVAVAEGTVALGRRGVPPATLSRGEAAGYGPLGLAPPRPAALERLLAWRQGRLVFEDAPLGDVLAELQRHLPERLVLADPAAGQLRVTAVFDLARIAAAPDTLAATLPLRVKRIGDFLVLIDAAG